MIVWLRIKRIFKIELQLQRICKRKIDKIINGTICVCVCVHWSVKIEGNILFFLKSGLPNDENLHVETCKSNLWKNMQSVHYICVCWINLDRRWSVLLNKPYCINLTGIFSTAGNIDSECFGCRPHGVCVWNKAKMLLAKITTKLRKAQPIIQFSCFYPRKTKSKNKKKTLL